MSLQYIVASDRANRFTSHTSALVRCPCSSHEDKNPSCQVTEHHDRIIFHCHAGCDWKDVRDSALSLGWIEKTFKAIEPTSWTPSPKKTVPSATAQAAMRILSNASNAEDSSIARSYWSSRGLEFNTLKNLKIGSVFHTETQRAHFALISPVVDLESQPTGAHLTYLEQDGSKLSAGTPRKMLGKMSGNCVHLSEAGPELALAEGVESAAAFQELTGIPTWATLSTSGLAAVKLPPLPKAQTVYIAADSDKPGIAAAHKAAQRFALEGRIAMVTPPPTPGDDWNDALKREAR